MDPPWNTMADHRWSFDSAANDTPEQLYAAYHAAVPRARQKVDAALSRTPIPASASPSALPSTPSACADSFSTRSKSMAATPATRT